MPAKITPFKTAKKKELGKSPFSAPKIIADLYEFNRYILSGHNLHELKSKVFQRAIKDSGADSGSLMSFSDKDHQTLFIEKAFNIPQAVVNNVRVQVPEGVSGHVAKTKVPLLLLKKIKKEDDRFLKVFTRKHSQIPGSSLSLPILAQKKVLGVLNLNRDSAKEPFTEFDLQRFLVFTSIIGVAIDMAMLKEKEIAETKRNEQLLKEVTLLNMELELKIRERTLSLNDANYLLRRSQNELKEKNEHLHRLVQLKDEFFSMITHDLKNYSTSILLSSSMLVDNDPVLIKDKVQELGQVIYRKSKLIDQLINNILTSSKFELNQLLLHKRKVPISDFMSNFYQDFLTENHSLNRALSISLAEQLGHFFVDEAKMNEVLTNLFSNAVKYSGEGDKIALEVSLDQENQVKVSIHNTGKGVAKEHLQAIFEKFMRVQPGDGAGSGLGLAICKEIISAHGGTIWADSELGQWTKITFILPRE